MNIGLGIGLIVVICGAIAIGFMIAIDRCFGHPKERNRDGNKPRVGKVEIIEADGFYAVRQFGWYDYEYGYEGQDRLERISYIKTYLGKGLGWETSSPKWLYVDQNRFVSSDPEPVTLEFAQRMAEELRTRFSDYCRRRECVDKRAMERQRATDALRNGKVIG